MSRLNSYLRFFYNFQQRKKLKNKNLSLISSNCNGGCILSDLGLEFNSPFVNLSVKPADYIKLCGNLKHYLNCELIFSGAAEEGLPYPIGRLEDIKLYFVHYSSAEEAKFFWNIRKKRVDYDNLFFLFSDRGGCTYDMLKAYDALPYEHKAVFCHKKYPEIESVVYIPGFEMQDCVGVCLDFKSPFTYKKHYDAFDYVSWFNSGV